jgi:hypothetical protein
VDEVEHERDFHSHLLRHAPNDAQLVRVAVDDDNPPQLALGVAQESLV